MRVGIFYFRNTPAPVEEVEDYSDVGNPPVGVVRVEVVIANSLSHALDMARPRAGEVVMNTHPLDPADGLDSND